MWTYANQSFETLRECIESILHSLAEPEGTLSVIYFQEVTNSYKTIRSLYYQRKDGVLKYDWIFTELDYVPGPWVIRLGNDQIIIGGV